jgi:hypothetical protein
MARQEVYWISSLFLLAAIIPAVAVEFKPAVNYPVGLSPVEVALADLNGDGKQDLVVLNVGSNLVGGSVSILLGNGNGTFQPARNFEVTAKSVAVADFNGDHKPDLALAGAPPSVEPPGFCHTSATQIMLGNGDGSFGTPQEVLTVGSVDSLAMAGDLNGDGRADLIVQRQVVDSACPPGGVSIFLGKGDGTFQGEIQQTSADLNGDGIPDQVVLSLNKVAVLLGTGNGNFQALAADVESSTGSRAFGDFNGDQKKDKALIVRTNTACIICPPRYVFNVGIALNNGDGTYQNTKTFGGGGHVMEVGIGDFNHDGKLDAAAINFDSPTSDCSPWQRRWLLAEFASV